ncbi:T9SS type A sorting domain-containing protein [bacterium]|nr:T9SS type A sorting domain-containing protein [bacterium]
MWPPQNFRNNNNKEEGSLFALDPSSGEILAQYDPSDDVPAAVGGLNSPAIGADGIIYVGVRGKFEQALVEPVNGHVFALQFDEVSGAFQRLWSFEVEGHIEWTHPAIGPDGGIYIGSSVGDSDLTTYDLGVVPPNSTCKFYALKGPTNPVSVRDEISLPQAFTLKQNYPNPFNPETVIEYHLTQSGHVRLTVYNVLGESVATLVSGWQPKGNHRVVWNGKADFKKHALGSGVFVYELTQGTLTLRRKMLLLH